MAQVTDIAPMMEPAGQPEMVEPRAAVHPTTGRQKGANWLHTHLRNLIALTLTGIVGWLALRGQSEAITALIAAFSVLMGAIWGERAALKVPGQDS